MTIQSDMAFLAAGSLGDIRKGTFNQQTGIDTDNDAPLPIDWTVVPGYDRSFSGGVSSGFSARVYKNTASQELGVKSCLLPSPLNTASHASLARPQCIA